MNQLKVEQASRTRWMFQKCYRMVAEYFESPVQSWSQVTLMLTFGLLLVLVVICCTGHFSPLFAVAMIAVLAIVVIVIACPQYGLLLVFLCAGLPSLLIPLPGHTMRPIEGALVLCVVVVIIRRPRMHLSLAHLLMLLFVCIAVISFVHEPVRATGLDSYGADKRLFDVALLLLAFFGGTFLVGYVKDISTFLSQVLLCNLPFCLIGLAQWRGIHLPTLLVPSQAIEVLQEGRLSGPADSPTTFAFYLINLFAVALACWLLGTRRRERVIGAIMTIIIALNIIGSGTRSATCAAVVLVIFMLLVNRRIRLLFWSIVLIASASIFFFDKIVGKFIHDPNSTTNRFFLWGQAWKLISANPWIGVGMEQFPVYYNKLIVSMASRLNPAGVSVHNQYLELALESGIPWLLLGLCLLLSIAFACWKVYHLAQRKQQSILLAVMAIIVSNLIICFVDVPLDKAEGGVFLFLLAGMALGYVEAVHRDTRRVFVKRALRLAKLAHTPTISATGSGSGLYEQVRYVPPVARLHSYQATMPLPGIVINPEAASRDETAPSAKKSSFAVIIQLISWAIAIPLIFPSTALLTHYLQPVQYGEYSFTMPFLAICALFTCTGMDPLLVRRLSRQKRREWSATLSYSAGTRLCTTLLVSLVALAVVFVLPVGGEQRTLLLLGIGTLVFSYSFNCVRGVYESGFVAEQSVTSIAILSTLNRLLTAGLIVVAVFAHFSLVQAYMLIVYSDLPFFLVLVFLARRHFHMYIRISLPRMREVLLESLSITGHDALALVAGQADLLLLLPLAGAMNVGIYALAMRITDPLLNVVYAYVSGLFPFLAAKFEDGHAAFSLLYCEATRIMALCIIPLAVFVSVEAPSIVALLGGEHFVAAVPATRILMWSVTVAFFGNLALQTSLAANKERRIPYATALVLSVNVLANILLIPFLQTTGAALASLASEVVGFCLFSALLMHEVRLSLILRVIVQVLLGNVPGLFFLIWQQHLSLLLLLPIFGMLTIVGCMSTRALSIKDVSMVRQLLAARKGKRAVTQ